MMTVLLIGATGTIGPHVVAGLLARNADAIRVLTRNVSRARGILPHEVDLVEGDPGVEDTVVRAANGATAVFLLTEHSQRMADLQLRVIRALRRSDTRIVKLSGTSSAINPDGPYTCRLHWEVEHVLTGSGQPWSLIRPNAYMQTLIDDIMLPAARATGAIPDAIGGAGISLVDGRDVGDVCAEVLVNADLQEETLVLTGPRAVTFPEIAALVAKESGHEVRTVQITPADVRDDLLARGTPRWEAEHFQEMYQLFRDGESAFVSGDVERILGRPPRTIEDYLREGREVLMPGGRS
jgi:uncharacterized protein YbjT (DUF2867 family)